MNYGLILVIGCVVLTARYALDSDASPIGRSVAVLAVAATFVLPADPWWKIAGIVTRLGVSLFVLLRLKIKAS